MSNKSQEIEMQSSRGNSTPKLTQEDIARKPWKYLGYHSFANFVASDHDFFLLRRFGSLNARVLLGLQDQLSQIEEQLNALEDHLRSKDGPNVHNGSFRQETQDERAQLVKLAQQVLHEYSQSSSISLNLFLRSLRPRYTDELVLQNSQLQARPPVLRRHVTSLQNWLYNNRQPILEAETNYINYAFDLFSLVPSPRTPLRSFLERFRSFRLLRLWREKKDEEFFAQDEHIHYISDKRIDLVISTIILLLGLAMLITPLWILAFVGDLVTRLAIICAFIVLFVVLLSITTVAKPFESLAAAAA